MRKYSFIKGCEHATINTTISGSAVHITSENLTDEIGDLIIGDYPHIIQLNPNFDNLVEKKSFTEITPEVIKLNYDPLKKVELEPFTSTSIEPKTEEEPLPPMPKKRGRPSLGGKQQEAKE